jgi:hypothetical protein
MSAKKVSRIVGFVFVVAAVGGIGATAWGSESDDPKPSTVVNDPRPSSSPPPPSPKAVKPGSGSAKSPADITWE